MSTFPRFTREEITKRTVILSLPDHRTASLGDRRDTVNGMSGYPDNATTIASLRS